MRFAHFPKLNGRKNTIKIMNSFRPLILLNNMQTKKIFIKLYPETDTASLQPTIYNTLPQNIHGEKNFVSLCIVRLLFF